MEATSVNSLLIRKYDRPVPRYTSYPTIPNWNDHLDEEQWKRVFTERFGAFNAAGGISIYIHLPFCESLCTYCGCNKKITTNHSVEEEYLLAIENEWRLYRKLMRQTPVIREIHLGGGTPTFFSPQNLKRLIESIMRGCIRHPAHEFSIEGHPNNTTAEHLRVLKALGFGRISYGVQDNDPEVQRIINRIQPLENVQRATENARAAGFESVNFDLIYGLPRQTVASIERTIGQVIQLKPDRIAYYSYAHVPWTSRAQRLFDETDLPDAEKKIALYLKGKEMLLDNGYEDIGMDHFALPTDDLHKAWKAGRLYRNFMGYTTKPTGLLLGLGVSAISDSGNAFAQNEKNLHDYYTAVHNNRLPIRKGYLHSDLDIVIRRHILDISCRGYTTMKEEHLSVFAAYTLPALDALQKDGLVELNGFDVRVTQLGRFFIRTICAAFDQYLNQRGALNEVFSSAI